MSTDEERERQPQIEQAGEALLIKGRVTELERKEVAARKRDDDYKERQTLYSQRVAWFTGALVLTSIVTNIIYLDMSCTARKSTEAARIAANASSQASDTAAQTLKDSKASFNQTLLQMQAQTAAQQKTADASKIQADTAKNSLGITQEALRNDQRAWVGMMEMTPAFNENGKPLYIKDGSKAVFGVVLANSGKSPALNVRCIMTAKIYPSNIEFVPIYDKLLVPQSVTVLQPGARVSITTPPSDSEVTESIIGAIKNRSLVFYVYGQIAYEDTFHRSHKTTFCTYVDQELMYMNTCGHYNEAD